MLSQYIQTAMRHAQYEILPDDGSYYGEVKSCPGVWANARGLEACREGLQSALKDWIVFRLRNGLDLPVIDGIDLSTGDQAAEQEVA